MRRAGRERAGRFLVEGAQAVREALRYGRVHEVFATAEAAARHADLLVGAPVHLVTDAAAAALSETVTPQGLVAVCDLLDVPLSVALAPSVGPLPPPRAPALRRPAVGPGVEPAIGPGAAVPVGAGAAAGGLVAVCVDIADPGNAGTVMRVADAAGAGAVILAGDTVDPHNGKAVRASTGSVFHLPLARERDVTAALDACRAAGLTLLVADGHGEVDLHDPAAAPVLSGPVAWIFGAEAHGVPDGVAAQADHRVRVPLHGRAESLNLAAAAAVCLYATVGARRAHR